MLYPAELRTHMEFLVPLADKLRTLLYREAWNCGESASGEVDEPLMCCCGGAQSWATLLFYPLFPELSIPNTNVGAVVDRPFLSAWEAAEARAADSRPYIASPTGKFSIGAFLTMSFFRWVRTGFLGTVHISWVVL